MGEARQPQQAYFLTMLRTVAGQAFDAAGYVLQRAPLQWAGGKYRFLKDFDDGWYGLIDFQVLIYSDTMWATGGASRFQVRLTRTGNRFGLASGDDSIVTRNLGELVVADFGVNILPSADHWWSYTNTDSLAHGLAEAGHLIVGYGIPWLAGDLMPPPD